MGTSSTRLWMLPACPANRKSQAAAKLSSRPNGIALSPNGRILYVTDSDNRSVLAYELDRNGQPTKQRMLVENTGAVPDGIRVDEKGNLYVAAGEIQVYRRTYAKFSERPQNSNNKPKPGDYRRLVR